MASIQFSLASRYSLKNYKDVIDTYEWLSCCLKYAFSDFNDLKITSSFSFSCDSLDIECRSISEFKELAFGMDIIPRHLFVHATESSTFLSKTLAHFWTRNNPEDVVPILELTCYEKRHLIAIKDSLDLDMSVLILKRSDKIESEPDKSKAEIVATNKTQTNTSQAPILQEEITQNHRGLFFSKMFWNLIIPTAVVVLSAVLVWLLQIK